MRREFVVASVPFLKRRVLFLAIFVVIFNVTLFHLETERYQIFCRPTISSSLSTSNRYSDNCPNICSNHAPVSNLLNFSFHKWMSKKRKCVFMLRTRENRVCDSTGIVVRIQCYKILTELTVFQIFWFKSFASFCQIVAWRIRCSGSVFVHSYNFLPFFHCKQFSSYLALILRSTIYFKYVHVPLIHI